MKKRITYLDLAKGIGIILVVLGHMENIDAGIRTWISSFHMPLFFIISGMLIAVKHEEEKNEREIICKKAKGILIPYMWFSIIYVPIDIMNLYIHNVDQHTFIQNILDSITFSGISVMWFLPALFIAEVTAVVIIKRFSNNDNSVLKLLIPLGVSLLVFLCASSIWNFGFRALFEANSENYAICTVLGFIRSVLRGLSMNVHVVIGYTIFRIIEISENTVKNLILAKYKASDNNQSNNSQNGNSQSESKIDLEIRGYCIALGIIFSVINAGLCMKNGAVDNHFLTLNNLFIYLICAVLGSLGLIFICKGFDSIKPIDYLGKNSLIIMATHLQCYMLYAGILVAIAIDRYVTRAKSYVYMFNSVLFTMLFELVIILVINCFFPFITGKESIKTTFNRYFKKEN